MMQQEEFQVLVPPEIYRICNQTNIISKNYAVDSLYQLLYSTHLSIMQSYKIFFFMSSRPDYLDDDCKSFFNITWKVVINDERYNTCPFVLTVNSKLKINTADVKSWFDTRISIPLINKIQSVNIKNFKFLQIYAITCVIDFEDFYIKPFK